MALGFRWVVGAIAGGLLLLVPLIAVPAGAAPATTQVSQRITFIDTSGYGVTCELDAAITRDHDAKTLSVQVSGKGISSTDNLHHLAECGSSFSEVIGDLAVDYVDTAGRSRHTETQSNTPQELDLDHVDSSVHITASARYTACDSNASTACTVSVTAAPK